MTLEDTGVAMRTDQPMPYRFMLCMGAEFLVVAAAITAHNFLPVPLWLGMLVAVGLGLVMGYPSARKPDEIAPNTFALACGGAIWTGLPMWFFTPSWQMASVVVFALLGLFMALYTIASLVRIAEGIQR